MANIIQIKRKTTTGAPTVGSLAVGEGCLVIPDNTLYYKKDAGTLLSWPAGAGAGDMLAATYDPNTVAGDAFDMDSMVEGATTKILTDTERTAISNNTAKVTYDGAAQVATNKTNADASKVVTDHISVTQAVDLDTIESNVTTNNAKVSYTDSAAVAANTSKPDGSTITAEIGAAIDALVGGAPGALDTLNELAAAMADDASYSATITAALATKLTSDSTIDGGTV